MKQFFSFDIKVQRLNIKIQLKLSCAKRQT